MSNFKHFGQAVNKRFNELSKNELYVAGSDRDALWNTYLAAFPAGTNPIYKVRTEFDCNCCKNFIRNLGSLVTIGDDGKVTTLWDIKGLEYPFDVVAAKLDEFVRSQAITSVFRTKEQSYGSEHSRQLREDKSVHTWDHFWGKVATRHQSTTPDKDRGNFNTTVGVFRRGLEELTKEAVDTVLGLIDSNALYRGEEHKRAVTEFRAQQQKFLKLDPLGRANFAFANANSPAARFRNTAIGTLVQDLSAGVDLENAVKSFEAKVAPTNYKRTTALITPRMVQDAMKTIGELGLEPALKRRLATIADVSINNVLWADNDEKPHMRDSVESLLMGVAKKSEPVNKFVTEIGINDFMRDVIPKAQAIDMHVRNAHTANFVTLTTESVPDSGKLFKWDNPFGWSYDGNITDSIREKVKTAGGDVNAALRFSLAWHNYDDLDIYLDGPSSESINFYSKHGKFGTLDVDMNAGGGRTREPVENIAMRSVPDGDYKIKVNCYSKRETTNVGFTVEVACGGQVSQYTRQKDMRTGENAVIGTFTLNGGKIVNVKLGADITGTGIPQTKWGVRTESPVKVRTIMASPNHWDDSQVGNKHWFFVLDGCKVSEPMRGIYNEFLDSSLEKHRKVFEVLGDKTKCEPTSEQLSGLGFSSTRGDNVLLSVTTDKATTTYNVQF